MIAALYVERVGAYSCVHGVDPWPEERDARTYTGPYPVVAHPPCQRWGKYWHGAPNKPTNSGLERIKGALAQRSQQCAITAA